jgi:hypothetical protein
MYALGIGDFHPDQAIAEVHDDSPGEGGVPLQ